MIAVLETATLADAVARASRIAPTKGAAWDKAAGIMLAYDPFVANRITVQSTDLETTFTRSVPLVESSDEQETYWRLPSALLNGILSALPLGHGHTVTLADSAGDGTVKIKAGKSVSKLRTMVTTWPTVQRFDPAGLTAVPDFAERLAQVSWCVDRDLSAPLCGVHLDGEQMIACDRIRAVRVPLKVAVDKPITAMLAPLTDVLRNAEEVSIRAEGDRLLLSPDRDTEVTTTLYAVDYPNVLALMREEFLASVTVSRAALDAAMNRMLVLVKGDRYPVVRIGFGHDTIGLVADDPEVGRMQDEIECAGGVDGETPFVMAFTPGHLLGAINGAGSDAIEIRFGPNALKPVAVVAGDYRAEVSPRALGSVTSVSAAA